MSFPRYPEYKDSGVEWLGEVPAHWQVARFSRVIAAIKDGTHGTFERVAEGRPLLSAKNVLNGHLDIGDAESLISDSDHAEIVANGFPRMGDLLLTIVGTIGRACVYKEAEPLAFQRSVCFIRLRQEIEPRLFYYFSQSKFFQEQLIGKSKSSAQAGVYMGDVASTSVLFPHDPKEQAAIVNFLDRETAKIDALVAEQEKLIALLQEKRQAVISHAVTKGLDPNVTMKNSGVEWLGEVPGHWEVGALSYLSTIETGSTPDRNEDRYWNGSIPWLKTGEINWAPIREAEEFITEEGLAHSAAKLSPAGTMLMAMYGQGVTRGRVALLEIDAAYNQACAAITFGPRIRSTFGRYFFMAAYDHIREGGNETSQMNLSAGLIAKFRMTIPPIAEQTEIVDWLDAEVAKLDVLSSEAELATSLLQERRTAVISAAVTGQIDVRGLVGGANAPDSVAASVYPASA